MFRRIFCGCTSNKNISSEVIILNVEDISDKEDKNESNKVEEEQDPALIEKNAKLNIGKVELTLNISSPTAPQADAPSADAPQADAPSVDAPSVDAPQADAPSIEEDQEIIDILTEKPVENDLESKPITRKYLFF
jgi:DNA polymerase-3 subunit gamma/tau